MKTDTLLVEVRTEELPPPAVRVLAEKFPKELLNRLREGGFTESQTPRNGIFATPRRFAALIDGVQERAKDRKVARRGPQVKDGLDSAGKPSPALQGFMRAVGVTDVTQLARENEKGREYFVWRGNKPGAALADVLPQMVTDSMCAVPNLPSMSWDAGDYAFVRPVRGLVMMLGGDVISGKVMGVESGRITRGHPALAEKPVQFECAKDYADVLRAANIIVDYDERRREVSNLTNGESDIESFAFGGKPGFINEESEKLINDVTAMCENPRARRFAIDGEFWQLPPDCVASCLIRHQKCFPFYTREKGGLTLSGFFFVADNEPENTNKIVTGINAVVRARLQDLKFYWQEDKKLTQKNARKKLGGIAYHRELGSQSKRAKRIVTIADFVGKKLGSQSKWTKHIVAVADFAGKKPGSQSGRAKRIADIANSIGKIMKLNAKQRKALKRAAKVCKLDLPTMMVAEYPELAGKMAAHYFCSGDSRESRVARSIVERHGSDDFEFYLNDNAELPAIALFLADKLEKIIGMFLVGEKPAGRKDPHGLRRAAGQIADVLALENMEELGLGDMSNESFARIEKLSLNALIDAACDSFSGEFDAQKIDADEVHEFISKRALPDNYDAVVINAVCALRPDFVYEIKPRCEALQEFLRRKQASALIAANKRINNILRKSDTPELLTVNASELPSVNKNLLKKDEEEELHKCVASLEKETPQLIAKGDYHIVLSNLADAATPIDEFFNEVMVNDKNAELRANRLVLLAHLRAQLKSVANLARLSG